MSQNTSSAMKLNLEFPSENCSRISTGGFADV